jgi:OOP family OmpA-OmpF porin
MRRLTGVLVVASVFVCMLACWTPAGAQLGGLKDKLKKKAEDKVEEKIDKAMEGSETDTTQAEEAQAAPAAKASGGTATSEDMTLYTKYDFIPGDKVIFYDDLSGEEIGEFPSRWKLVHGVFEIARKGNENYIMCTDEGYIAPKIPPAPLPPKYTVEMEFYSAGPEHRGHWFFIEWMDAEDNEIAEFSMTNNEHTALTILGDQIANKQLPTPLGAGDHTMRVMATATTLKCYIDNERVANVPAVEGFHPVGFRVHMDPWSDEAENPMLMRSFRFAEGGKTMKQQLDETGRIITHGILFDSGSDRIKAESYKTLADIGKLLTENPDLRLSIEGHTDSDGAEDYNLDLSKRRANSVKTYLVETYKIDANRLEAKGLGETMPIDTNDSPEGKANNRRVELVKL